MNKENVLKIVDSCMHEFASSHRGDAKEKADKLYDILNAEAVKENCNLQNVSDSVCDCERVFGSTQKDDGYWYCDICNAKTK